jgi:hypothetical protein
MSQDQYDNLTADHERAASERDRIAALFGEDALIGTEPLYPTTGRTAHDLAALSLAAARERQQAEDLELVQVAAQEQDEDEALDLALRKMRRGGGRLPAGTMAKAGKALRRRGYTRGTTAQQLARMAGQGPGWRPAP